MHPAELTGHSWDVYACKSSRFTPACVEVSDAPRSMEGPFVTVMRMNVTKGHENLGYIYPLRVLNSFIPLALFLTSAM